jgi:hypothetical protein
MRVYKFLSRNFGLKVMRERRIKISEIHDLNDPFELVPFDLSDPLYRKGIELTRDQLAGVKGMVCFARHWRDPVLWAHYSDKHRGMALGFDVPDDCAQSVRYIEERLPARPPDYELAHDMLFTKFAGWAYEVEIRIFTQRDEKEDGLYFAAFGDNLMLREVIAGQRCCISRSEIVAVLGEHLESTHVVKARLSHTTFDVEEDPDGFSE